MRIITDDHFGGSPNADHSKVEKSTEQAAEQEQEKLPERWQGEPIAD